VTGSAPHPLVSKLLAFGRVLRRAGVDVHPGRLLDVIEALGHIDLRSRNELYHACRALLVHRHEQIRVFDRAFAAFWLDHPEELPARTRPDQPHSVIEVEAMLELRSLDRTDHDSGTESKGVPTWSDLGGLATRDFGSFSATEIAEGAAALSRLVWTPGERRTPRWVRGRGSRIDLRRSISESLRTDADVVNLWRRTRRVRPRPLVLLCDVSRSMEHYTRMLLHFAQGVTQRHHRVEAFLFSTTLTRITRQLRLANPVDALAAVSRTVADWSGGTRIGESLKEFHQRWSRRVMNGGPVVLLISDGWDCGDPSELAAQIVRLQRSCHRLIWLSPLLGTEGYEPLTRGLQAALPYVDDFLPARTLTNLADLAVHLNTLPT
jgi:uncharacterized protein with von Willebrand factor type A (vWA) domain